MAKLGETKERLTTLGRRQREIADKQAALANQDLEPEAVRHTVAQFTDIWDVLLKRERERIVRLLFKHVDYDGSSGQLKLTFSATGAAVLAADAVSLPQGPPHE
jgi:hypothetical protein